jgi:hypothetical protein
MCPSWAYRTEREISSNNGPKISVPMFYPGNYPPFQPPLGAQPGRIRQKRAGSYESGKWHVGLRSQHWRGMRTSCRISQLQSCRSTEMRVRLPPWPPSQGPGGCHQGPKSHEHRDRGGAEQGPFHSPHLRSGARSALSQHPRTSSGSPHGPLPARGTAGSGRAQRHDGQVSCPADGTVIAGDPLDLEPVGVRGDGLDDAGKIREGGATGHLLPGGAHRGRDLGIGRVRGRLDLDEPQVRQARGGSRRRRTRSRSTGPRTRRGPPCPRP